MEQRDLYIEAQVKKLEGIKYSLIGNCKRLIHILENIPDEELVRRGNWKLRAELKNKCKEIRRDTITLAKEILF